MSIYSFLLQYDRCCRRRHQRHGRIQERSGPEMYTVPCATSSLLPLLRAPSSRRVGFGRCSPSTTSTTQRTSSFPNPRRPLVSVSSRSGSICKLLPQLHVCVFRLVTMVRIWCTRSLGTQLPGSPASPQRAGRWSPWTPKKGRWTFFYSLTRRSRVQVLPTRARNHDTWDRRRIVNNMR